MGINNNMLSHRAASLPNSTLGQVMQLAVEKQAVNLAIGIPEFPTPGPLKEEAVRAIQNGVNQYANIAGMPALRQAVAQSVADEYGVVVSPETEITVTCGTTEAMFAALTALINPGDEVILFEPFFVNYVTAAALQGATIRTAPLHRPNWEIDFGRLAALFNDRTKAILINSPHNPTGKLFSREELSFILDLCEKWDVVCISDEIYDRMVFDDRPYTSLLAFPKARNRVVVINGLSKSFSVTGWRVGYLIAPPVISEAVRRIHFCLTAGAPAPLQKAAVAAFQLPPSYYDSLRQTYQAHRGILIETLEAVGFHCYQPQGACYVMADFSQLSDADDHTFAHYLITQAGVAAAPATAFYLNPPDAQLLRFCFAKTADTLAEANRRLVRHLSRAVLQPVS